MGRLLNTAKSILTLRGGRNLDSLLEMVQELNVRANSVLDVYGMKVSADLAYKGRWIGTAYRHRFIESRGYYLPNIQSEVERIVRQIQAFYMPNKRA